MTTSKRAFTPSKARLRNLNQYKDMSDNDFDNMFETNFTEEEIDDAVMNEELDKRFQEELNKIKNDYDLDDMKANDLMQLRSLILATIQLEDLEHVAMSLRDTVTDSTVMRLEKVNRIMSSLRADISTISNDLQITKKVRNRSKETSVINRWNDLGKKALEFYKQKHLYIFCEECKLLLSTVWLLYTDEQENTLHLVCNRCGAKTSVNLAGLYEKDNKNIEDVVIP